MHTPVASGLAALQHTWSQRSSPRSLESPVNSCEQVLSLLSRSPSGGSQPARRNERGLPMVKRAFLAKTKEGAGLTFLFCFFKKIRHLVVWDL